jgi:hypothetical protein
VANRKRLGYIDDIDKSCHVLKPLRQTELYSEDVRGSRS